MRKQDNQDKLQGIKRYTLFGRKNMIDNTRKKDKNKTKQNKNNIFQIVFSHPNLLFLPTTSFNQPQNNRKELSTAFGNRKKITRYNRTVTEFGKTEIDRRIVTSIKNRQRYRQIKLQHQRKLQWYIKIQKKYKHYRDYGYLS